VRKDRTNRGFTIMEVMVSVAILSMIAAIIYESFGRMMFVRDEISAVQERYQQISYAMNRMAREISMAYLSLHRSIENRTITFFKSEQEGSFDRLTFTSLAGLRLYKDANSSDEVVIGYYVESDPEEPDKMNLMRREKRRIDDKLDEEDDENWVSFKLCDDIEELHFEFYDPVQDDWVETWDTTSVERGYRLPPVVKITMTVEDEHGEQITYVTKTQIFMVKPISFGLE